MRTFDVEVTAAGERIVVRPVGDLDLATVTELDAALEAGRNGNSQLIVDLRGLTFMDSVGLNVLLKAARQAAEHGVAFRVIRGTRMVDRIFDITNTRSELDFVDLGVEAYS